MTTPQRKLIAGNWKMNGLEASLVEARAVAEALALQPCSERVAICPPATLIASMVQALAGSPVLVGGQNCYVQAAGAFTGEISAEMLADACT